MWQTRKELEGIRKILHLEVDIDKLKYEYEQYTKNKPWNAYWTDFKAMGELNAGIKVGASFIDNMEWDKQPTQQLALTTFDENYEIPKDRNSGSRWDSHFMLDNKQADGRCYSKFKDDLLPYTREVLNMFQPGLSRTMFSKIKPESDIKPHIDHDALLSVRYHIALETNPDSYLCYIKDGTPHKVHIPADGSVWFLNPGITHWAENNGKIDRTHLIINMENQRLYHDSFNE